MENVLRKQMVADAINQAGTDAPITVEHIGRYLPEDFELGADDLAPFAPTEEAEPAPEAEAPFDWGALSDQIDNVRAKRLAGQAEATPAPALPGDIESATARRLAADSRVNNARVALIVSQNAERDARKTLADAVVQFQSGFARVTPEQLRRSHVQEQAAIRQGLRDGTIPSRPNPGIGRSAVDRAAYYQKFGHGAGAGGGRAYARGAAPSQYKGGPNFDPRRGPVVKTPTVG